VSEYEHLTDWESYPYSYYYWKEMDSKPRLLQHDNLQDPIRLHTIRNLMYIHVVKDDRRTFASTGSSVTFFRLLSEGALTFYQSVNRTVCGPHLWSNEIGIKSSWESNPAFARTIIPSTIRYTASPERNLFNQRMHADRLIHLRYALWTQGGLYHSR
jgi:hypothetical protein